MEIYKLNGELEVLTGLHIGAGDDVMKIGGVSNSVIKDANSNEPYIPGSSIKGKMRSLLEWHYGLVNIGRDDEDEGKPFSSKYLNHPSFPKDTILIQDAENILKLFGDANAEEDRPNYGITRLSFSDCEIVKNEAIKNTESKYENVIDRTNGTAKHPRQTERVCKGVKFKYSISLKIFEQDDEKKLKDIVKNGLELIENDYLGGNGTRGYGRVSFSNKDDWK